VALNIDAVLREISLAKRKKMLQKVATTGVDLDRVYGQTLQRIRDQEGSRSRLGMEVLMWISHAERPLRIDELCHALAVEIDSRDLDPENVTPQDTVLGSCLGLAVVDSETSTVRPIHYTLREYLSQPGVLPDAHRTLGQTCLTYLNYDQVKGLPVDKVDKVSGLEGMPFLEYASLHWGDHAKVELLDHAKSLALKLLSQYDSHISSRLLFNQIHNPDPYSSSHRLISGLHCASYFGIDEVVAALIEMKGCNINRGDSRGFTPLMLAAQRGNQGTVALLLTRDNIRPDKPDDGGTTPLLGASRNGHEGVVRLLLTRGGVDPDGSDNHSRTPLWWASFSGHEGVVRQLLAQDDVNPDEPDKDGRTALWAAAHHHGHEGVVRLLLVLGKANPDKLDKGSKTPLWAASRVPGMVRLLLARGDVNPDRPDNNGGTPL